MPRDNNKQHFSVEAKRAVVLASSLYGYLTLRTDYAWFKELIKILHALLPGITANADE